LNYQSSKKADRCNLDRLYQKLYPKRTGSSILLLFDMAAAAFNRRIGVFLPVNLFMAILAQFMGSLLETVDFRVADIQSMTIFAFINNHYIILGVMAGCAAV